MRSIRPCWPWPAKARTSATTRPTRSRNTFLTGNFDPAFTKLKVVKNGTEFNVSAATNAGLAFGSLFGYQSWPIQAAASADIAYASYEIALVLDTTGSMKGGKLASMKDAVLGLIGTMSVQVNDTDKLKFAVVPFSAFVNVGPGYGPTFDKKGKQVARLGRHLARSLGQLRPCRSPSSAPAPAASRSTAMSGRAGRAASKRAMRASKDYDVDDTPADPGKAETLFVPAFGIDEPDTPQFVNSYIKSDAKPHDKSVAEKKKRWNKYGVKTDGSGCRCSADCSIATVVPVARPARLDFWARRTVKIDTSLASDGKPKGPGHGCDVQPITPLTNDYASLKAKVNALQANGNTNIMEGVAWGNRVLSPGQPFAEGSAPKTGLEKIMVVLTDGSNVFGNATNELGSSYSSNGYLVDGRLGIAAGGASATNTLMNAAHAEGM